MITPYLFFLPEKKLRNSLIKTSQFKLFEIFFLNFSTEWVFKLPLEKRKVILQLIYGTGRI